MMFYIKYNKNSYKILGYYTNDIGVDVTQNEDIKKIDIHNMSQTDIRAYNEDGSIKSLGEQIKEKIIILKNNEVVKDGVIVELNSSYEDDYIRLVQRNILNLDSNYKIEYDRDSKKYHIIEKTIEEKFQDKVISLDDYNKYIIESRYNAYSLELDSKRSELLDSILKRLGDENILLDREKELLFEIFKIREDIKSKYKKI